MREAVAPPAPPGPNGGRSLRPAGGGCDTLGDRGVGDGRAGRRAHVRVGERTRGRGRSVVLAAGRGAPGAHGVGGVRADRAGGVHCVGSKRGQVCACGLGIGGWWGWSALAVVLLLMSLLLLLGLWVVSVELEVMEMDGDGSEISSWDEAQALWASVKESRARVGAVKLCVVI